MSATQQGLPYSAAKLYFLRLNMRCQGLFGRQRDFCSARGHAPPRLRAIPSDWLSGQPRGTWSADLDGISSFDLRSKPAFAGALSPFGEKHVGQVFPAAQQLWPSPPFAVHNCPEFQWVWGAVQLESVAPLFSAAYD
ncbi:hypothetical protein NMY22_g15595 [Coprinellus aureogranulatus]|nr:hypothetical protein NMY22_g15595 [Coprinellus aureogranulatus]